MHDDQVQNTGVCTERMLKYPKLAQCLPGPLLGVQLAPARVAGPSTGKQTFQIRCMSAVAGFQAVQIELQRLCKAVAHYASTHNTVKGTERLLKRAQRDLASTDYFAQEENAGFSSSQASSDCVASLAAAAQLQGARNNLRGMQAELDVAQQATNVVCLGARFYSQWIGKSGEIASSKHKQRKPNNAGQDAPQAMTQHLQYVKAMQDQATALSNSVQDLQQQLKDLQLPDQIQQELVPIQDSVRKTTQDLNRLVGEQRQKNADAERLEGQAMKARMAASAAAERIQHCQNSLQAAEGRLAAKKHEINLKKQEAQFKAAELEFHQQQLQHVSEEQRQAEELIQISLDQNGGHSIAIPERMQPHRAHQQMAAPHAAMPDMPSYEQDNGSGNGEGIFNKLKGGMDKARMMGQKVVPRFGPDRERMAQAITVEQQAALSAGSTQARIAHQQELALGSRSTTSRSL